LIDGNSAKKKQGQIILHFRPDFYHQLAALIHKLLSRGGFGGSGEPGEPATNKQTNKLQKDQNKFK